MKILGTLSRATGFAFVVAFGATSAMAYDCRAPDQGVINAVQEALERAQEPGANAATAYCAAANARRAMIWKSLQCLNRDATLSPEHRKKVQAGLKEARRLKAQDMEGYRALSSGAPCECWSKYCAD